MNADIPNAAALVDATAVATTEAITKGLLAIANNWQAAALEHRTLAAAAEAINDTSAASFHGGVASGTAVCAAQLGRALNDLLTATIEGEGT